MRRNKAVTQRLEMPIDFLRVDFDSLSISNHAIHRKQHASSRQNERNPKKVVQKLSREQESAAGGGAGGSGVGGGGRTGTKT